MKKNDYKKRLLLGLLSFLIILPLTGCWSSQEIEDLGLIVGTALDLESGGSTWEDQETEYSDRQLITITNQFVTSETTGTGVNEGSSQPKYKNVSETGDAILPTLRDMILKIDKRAFADHSKVLIIGEELASTVNLQQLLDFFLREEEIRPSSHILIAQNRASDTLESKETVEIPAFQIVEMIKSQERTSKILPPMTFAKLEGKLNSGASFLLQNIVSDKGEVKFAGAAVIEGKTKKLLGVLNEKDLEGVMWITGEGKGGLVKSFDEETGKPIIYEVLSMKSEIIPYVVGDKISFDINIKSEGRLAEHWVLSGKPFHNEFLKKAEKVSEKEVEDLVKSTIDKIQNEYQVDVLGFGNRMRIDHPRLWKKIKKDWDQTFSQVSINCKVKFTIKDYGTTGY